MNVQKHKKQAGFVVTVELLLIVVILVMGLVAGWAHLRDSTLSELNDTGKAIGAIDQSYIVYGTNWHGTTALIASHVGFQFEDDIDAGVGGVGTNVGGDGQEIRYGTAPTAANDTGAGEANVF